jgi:hypothetical protein
MFIFGKGRGKAMAGKAQPCHTAGGRAAVGDGGKLTSAPTPRSEKITDQDDFNGDSYLGHWMVTDISCLLHSF